jgi:dUTP pyrophosphatase
MPPVKVFRKDPAARLPEYATGEAAGADLRARLSEPVIVPPLGRARIPTGLALEIPPGYEGQVRPRSGLAFRYGVTVLNSPGTIDSDYRGELGVILINLGNEDFTVNDGDRVAQLVIAPVCGALFEETDGLSETNRGSGGFGSTGV